ncbi:MAG: cell division protein ZapA [Terriglobia bacterium]
MSRDIRLEIYGQVYSLRTDLEPDYVEKLAAAVDANMQALARQTDTVDTRRLAILAALNLADELQQLKEKVEAAEGALPGEFIQRLENCNQQLEAALGHKVGD